MHLFQNICYLDLGDGEAGRLEQVAAGGAELLAGVWVARRKAWPAVEKCLLKFSIIVDLSVVTVLPSLSAVGFWEEVLLFSMDLSQNFLELELQDANVCLKKLAFAFLTDCVYWFLTSLNSCMVAGTIRCYCSPPQDVFVLVKGSQVWSEPRAISVLGSAFFERGNVVILY